MLSLLHWFRQSLISPLASLTLPRRIRQASSWLTMVRLALGSYLPSTRKALRTMALSFVLLERHTLFVVVPTKFSVPPRNFLMVWRTVALSSPVFSLTKVLTVPAFPSMPWFPKQALVLGPIVFRLSLTLSAPWVPQVLVLFRLQAQVTCKVPLLAPFSVSIRCMVLFRSPTLLARPIVRLKSPMLRAMFTWHRSPVVRVHMVVFMFRGTVLIIVRVVPAATRVWPISRCVVVSRLFWP